MIYGYARVSTTGQRLDRQIKNINDYVGEKKLAKIFSDKFSGVKLNRPEFQKMLKVLKNGDVVVLDSVSRLSRNAKEGYELYMELLEKGVNLCFIKEPHINTEYYKSMQAKKIEIASTGKASADKLVSAIIEAITEFQNEETKEKIRIAFDQAEKEVTDIRQRISEGIRTTKEKNELSPENERKQIGLKQGTKLTTKKSVKSKEKIRKMSRDFEGNMLDKEVIEMLGLSRNTYFKYKKEMRMEEVKSIS